MKFIAVSALAVAAAAQSGQAAVPSQTLNQAQQQALASLSAAQAQMNAQNSQMIAADRASQEAAIFSQSGVVHQSELHDLGSLDSSESESMEDGSVHEHDSESGAASVTSSVLAVALAVAALF